MEKTIIDPKKVSDFLGVSREVIVRAVKRTIKVLEVQESSLKLNYKEFETLSEHGQDKTIYASALIKLDRVAHYNRIEKLKCFINKESDYFPEEIDMELAINKFGEISFIDHKAPYGGYRSIEVPEQALVLKDEDFRVFLRGLRDKYIQGNEFFFNKFKEIVKSQKPAFKATFKNAKEHLKNIKFPTLEDLKPEQALGEIPFPFKETQDPVEQLKIGMCAKRRNEIRLRYRLPYLYQIMLYNFEMKAENGGVEISYGEGWDNLSCRKYCKYVNDYEMKFDLAEYYGQNLGGVELKYYNDDAIYAWFDGNDVLDKAFDELIELDYEAVCSSDEEFIEYLKRKRDTVLKHVESVEKEAETYIKNNLHLAEELYEEKQRELKKMRF